MRSIALVASASLLLALLIVQPIGSPDNPAVLVWAYPRICVRWERAPNANFFTLMRLRQEQENAAPTLLLVEAAYMDTRYEIHQFCVDQRDFAPGDVFRVEQFDQSTTTTLSVSFTERVTPRFQYWFPQAYRHMLMLGLL